MLPHREGLQMAIVNFFDDILSEVTETRKVKNGQKLQSIINKYIEEKDAISVPYEVYDVESGNTSYITPETKEFRTLCLLNGNEQTDLEYKVKGNDIVSFIVIPEDSTQQWVNYLGGGLAIAGGVLLSVFTSGVGATIGAGLIYTGIGMVASQGIQDIIDYSSDSSSYSKKQKNDTMKEAENTLGLSDGSNQNILNHKYPILLGKHLLNPYTAGSAFNTTLTGENGANKGHYLTKLYEIADSPVKITDLKLGETMLAYNRTFEDTIRNSVMHGMLRGYNDADTGDILKKWKNNDVSVEILQAGTLLKDNENRYGTLYPQTVEQKKPDANILNIKDGDIKKVAERSYMGTSIPNGYKTNSVKFSRSCPQKIEVEFSFPNGLYAYRTRKEDGKIFYYNVPVSFAIQWRFIKKNQKSSDADSPAGWNNFDYIDVYDGQDIKPSYYTKNEKLYEYNSLFGKRDYLKTSNEDSMSEFFLKDKFINTEIFNLNGRYTSKDNATFNKVATIKCLVGLRKHNGVTVWSTNEVLVKTIFFVSSFSKNQILTSSSKNVLVTQPRLDPNTRIATSSGGKWVDNALKPNDLNEENGWTVLEVTEIIEADDYDAMIQVINNNTDNLSKHEISRDDINVSARSYVAVKEFTPNECAKLIGYHNDSDEHLDSVEVRVLRLTPAYFQEYTWKDSDSGDSHTISDEWTAMSYCDLMKWDYLRTFAFDKDKFKESLDDGSISLHEKGEDKQVMRKLPLRPIKDDDLNRFCYVAIKLKQDIAETAGKSLNQFSCIAQNLAPNYDTQSGNWVPAVISPKTNNYHKYLNSSKDYKIEDISEQEYLDALRQRKTVTLFIDGTDVTTNTVKSNITRYYLSEKGLEYSKLNNPGKDYIFNIDGTDYPVDLTNIYTDDTNRTIINGLYITTGKGDSYDGVFIKKTDNATHSVYIYKKDSSIKPSEYYQTADGNNFSEQLKKEIFNYSTLSNSSVDADILYTNRPMVYGSKLQQNGFTDAEPDKKYWVFAKKYTNENILNSKYPTYAIVVTPIKPDGTVLTKTELDTAANRLLRGQSDTDKILLASFKPVYAIKTGLSQSGKVYYYTSSVGNAANGADDYSLSEQADQYIQIQEKLQEIYNNQESEYYEKLSALSAKTPENIQIEDIEKYATNIGLSYDFSSVDSGTIDFYKKKILRILYRTTFIEALKQMGLVTLDESKSAKFYLPEYIEKKYCSQNVASQFLYALVGPALGIDAKTYDCVNMNSVKELYNFCADVTDGTKKKNSNELLHMKFSCNGVVSSEIKFETLLKNILLTGRSSLKRDEKNRYEVLLGKPTDYPVGVLNQQNIISKSNTRSLANEISGYLAEFTDETDNYTRNSLYVMNDGEDYRKPTKEISSIFINYVTNREQLYSLLRYNLCTVLYQKESYSYTVGSIGYALSVGDVLLIQDDSLLVGKESGARITSLITSNDGNYLYGITVDSPIEFSGKPGFGCTIVQPEKYQASRCITLEFCDKNGILVDSDKNIKLTPEIGLTNTLYFKEPIYLGSGTDSETGKVIQIVPKIGNLVAFGNLKAITEKGLVLSISPKDNGQFDIRLVPYRPELYNMGNKMPVFTANMTIPSREEEEFVFSDKTSAYDQEQKVADATASLTEKIDAISKDIDVTPPTSPVLTEAVSDDNGNITLVWNGSTDNKSGVSEYCIYHKTVGRFVRIQTIPHDNNSQAQYTFTHNTSEKFTTHYYYVTAKDKMNNESEPSETLSIENPVKTKPYEPKALKAMAMRDYIRLEWTCEQSTNASLNPRLFKVEIKRNDTDEWESVGEYSSRETLYYFDRSKDGYSEADKISKYQFRVKSVSVYELESEYCTSESVNVDNYLGWKIGDIEISSYATEGTLFIKASVKGSSYGDKFLNVKYGDEIVAENSLAGRMFYVKLNGYQEVSDITSKDIYVECYSVADNVSKTLAGSNIDTSLYKTYKITKPSVTAYADKQGIHISWSDNTSDYYLKPAYKLTIDGKEVLSAADTLDYSWLFAENTYPTKAEVLAHTIILSVSTAADSVEISDIATDISVFKGWIPDVPDIKLSVSGRTVPVSWNIQSDNVYDFLGCELQVAKGYKVTAGKYSVITDESELEWFAPALGLNPYESLENYKKGDNDGYLSVKGSSVAFSVPLFGQDNDGAMNTMYVYRARAFTKGGKSEWSDAYFIEVKPVSAYDVVKAWNINDSGEKVKIDGALGANQIFVNELSAICANLGYITDGALQTDSFNYWAVNDTPMKDGTILPKGSFRVGGANDYLEVTPILDGNGVATGDYNLTIVAKKFTTTTNVTILNNKLFLVRDADGNILFKAGVYEKNPDAIDDYGLVDGDDKNYIRVNEGYYTSKSLRVAGEYQLMSKEIFGDIDQFFNQYSGYIFGTSQCVNYFDGKVYYAAPSPCVFSKSLYNPYFISDKKGFDIYSIDKNGDVKKELQIHHYPFNGEKIGIAYSALSMYKGKIYYVGIWFNEEGTEQDVRLYITDIKEKTSIFYSIPALIQKIAELFGLKDSNFVMYDLDSSLAVSMFDNYGLVKIKKTVYTFTKESSSSYFVLNKIYYDSNGNKVSVTKDTYKSGTYYTRSESVEYEKYLINLDDISKVTYLSEDAFGDVATGWTSDDDYLYFIFVYPFASVITRIKKDSLVVDYCSVRLSSELPLEGDNAEEVALADFSMFAKNKKLKLIHGTLTFVGTYTAVKEKDDGSLEKMIYSGIFEIRNPIWFSDFNNPEISTISIYGEYQGDSVKFKSPMPNGQYDFLKKCYPDKNIYTALATDSQDRIFASIVTPEDDYLTSVTASIYTLEKKDGNAESFKFIEILGTIKETEIKTNFNKLPYRGIQVLNIKQLSETDFFVYYTNESVLSSFITYGATLGPLEEPAGNVLPEKLFAAIFNTEDNFITTQKRAYETGIGFSGFYKDLASKNYRYLLASGAYLEFDKDGKLVTDNRGPKGDTGSHGDKGEKGDKGDTGETGTSITKVEQIESSNLPNGINRLEITLSDGSKSEFSVKNGAVGDDDIVLTDDDFNDIMK